MSAIEVSGNPPDEELAALVVVLTAASASAPTDPRVEGAVSAWGSHERQVRRGLHPGPDAWRASALPR